MTAATDKELTALHKKVAQVMLQGLDQQTIAAGMLVMLDEADHEDADAMKDLIYKLRIFVERIAEVNPAFLQAVTKFLRDNDISAEIETSEELSPLAQKLATKTRVSVGNVTALYDTED